MLVVIKAHRHIYIHTDPRTVCLGQGRASEEGQARGGRITYQRDVGVGVAQSKCIALNTTRDGEDECQCRTYRCGYDVGHDSILAPFHKNLRRPGLYWGPDPLPELNAAGREVVDGNLAVALLKKVTDVPPVEEPPPGDQEAEKTQDAVGLVPFPKSIGVDSKVGLATVDED